MWTRQDTLIGSLRVIINAFDLVALADFFFELHHGQEEVDVEVQEFIQLVEELEVAGVSKRRSPTKRRTTDQFFCST